MQALCCSVTICLFFTLLPIFTFKSGVVTGVSDSTHPLFHRSSWYRNDIQSAAMPCYCEMVGLLKKCITNGRSLFLWRFSGDEYWNNFLLFRSKIVGPFSRLPSMKWQLQILDETTGSLSCRLQKISTLQTINSLKEIIPIIQATKRAVGSPDN